MTQGLRGPDQVHTLSMAMQYNSDILLSPWAIENKEESASGMRVDVIGVDAQDKPFERVLVRLRGKQDWRHGAFSLTPGVDFPLNAKSLSIRVGVWSGTGTVWVDNVQLEAKGHPTPFADGIRPPHEIQLATPKAEEDAS
jgi:hypothetical protein